MRITFSKTLLLATTAFSMISVPAANAYLSPLSFNEMYAHASRGNLTVLNNAILRGMNINAVNGDGDTGICVAMPDCSKRPAAAKFISTGRTVPSSATDCAPCSAAIFSVLFTSITTCCRTSAPKKT